MRAPAPAASAPPISGPTMNPIERADSTSPFARPISREPASSGTSANSDACETATPAPSTSVSARIAASESDEGEGTDDHRLEDRRPDRERARLHTVDEHADVPREHRERGPQADQAARPRPTPCHSSFARSESAIIATQSPIDETAIAPATMRRSRFARCGGHRRNLRLNRPFGQNPPYTNTRSRGTMALSMAAEELVVHGAREHNLKDITVRLPRNALICITGLSGSGKSSLAFDTIYAEGQRRYVESLSAYARQFLQMMEKPDVDSIDGLSPAISIDQKTTSRNPRSTVGTVTEIYDYLRLLFARVGRPHCPVCGRAISGQSIDSIVEQILALPDGDAVHRQRAGRARPEGRVQGALRGAPQRRLLPHQGGRRAAHARRAAGARQEVQAHDRGRRRPSGDEGRPAHASDAVRRDGGRARGRSRRGRPGRERRDDDLQPELRVPRARRVAARAPAAHLLVQLARTAPARAAPGSAPSRRSIRTCSCPTRRSRSTTARSSRGRSAAQGSTSR